MFTGVELLDDDYDIDVGLRFNVNKGDYKPLELKEKIHDILKNHTEYGADIRQHCVTVKYKKDGELAYHIDLVIYAYEDKDDKDSQLYLVISKCKGDLMLIFNVKQPDNYINVFGVIDKVIYRSI